MHQRRALLRRPIRAVLTALIGLGLVLSSLVLAPTISEATAKPPVTWNYYSDGTDAKPVNRGTSSVYAEAYFVDKKGVAKRVPGTPGVHLKPGQSTYLSVYLPMGETKTIFWVTFNGRPVNRTQAFEYGRKAPTTPRVASDKGRVLLLNAGRYKAKVVHRVNGGAKRTTKLAKSEVKTRAVATGKTVSYKVYVLRDGRWKKVGSGKLRVR